MANNDIMVKIAADISDLSKKMDEAAAKIDDALNKKTKKPIKETESLLKDLGKAFAMAFTVDKAIAMGKAIVDIGSTFEASMDKVAALSGATGDQLESLTDLARELGSTTRYSASEAADGLGYMALAGWNAEQMMDGLPSVLNLATAGQLDLARASDYVTDILTMYGMKAEEAGRMTDVLAYAQANSNTTVDMMGDALKYVGVTAQTFGMTIEDTAGALGMMANSGIKASMAGRSLKTILARLAAGTGECGDALAAMEIEVENTDGTMKDLSQILSEVKQGMSGMTEAQKVQTAKQIAGTEAMSAFMALVNSSGGELEGFTQDLYNSAGAAETIAKTMDDNLSGSFKTFKSTMEEAALSIYDQISPALRSITDGATSVGRAFTSLFKTGLEFSSGFGEVVSQGTTQALEPFQNLERAIGTTGQTMLNLGGTVTEEFATQMNTQLSQWSVESTALFDKMYQEDLAILQRYFENATGLDETHKQEMLNRLNGHYENEKNETSGRLEEIKGIIAEAQGSEQGFTQTHLDRILGLVKENRDDMVRLASTSAEEELAVLEAFSFDKDRITAESAEKTYQAARTQADNVISEAKKNCDQQIKEAYRLKQAGIIQEGEYQSMVNTAKTKYGEIENEAENKFSSIVSEISKQCKDMGKEFDRETGKIKSTWQRLKEALKPVNGVATITTRYVDEYYDRDYRKVKNPPKSSRSFDMPVTRATTPPPTPTINLKESTTAPQGNNSPFSITIGSLTVREEADVNKIAQELFRIQSRNNRGRGI